VPRLEFVWNTLRRDGDWGEYEVVCRLVYMHLEQILVAAPFSRTVTSNSVGKEPWEGPLRGVPYLPLRGGAQAHHDAAHLGVPLYAILPSGPVRLDGDAGYAHQAKLGLEARRP